MAAATPPSPETTESLRDKLARLKRELIGLSDLDAQALGRLFHPGEFSDFKRRMFPRDWS